MGANTAVACCCIDGPAWPEVFWDFSDDNDCMVWAEISDPETPWIKTWRLTFRRPMQWGEAHELCSDTAPYCGYPAPTECTPIEFLPANINAWGSVIIPAFWPYKMLFDVQYFGLHGSSCYDWATYLAPPAPQPFELCWFEYFDISEDSGYQLASSCREINGETEPCYTIPTGRLLQQSIHHDPTVPSGGGASVIWRFQSLWNMGFFGANRPHPETYWDVSFVLLALEDLT